MIYLDKHKERYPLMQIEDILKLHLQGILGPAHIVSNKEFVLKNITNEYNDIKNDTRIINLTEEISDKYTRIYLKPYFEKYNSFDNLVEAFYLSSLIKEDDKVLISEVTKLINDENKEFISKYLSKGNYLISHSQTYKNNYHAHYLVVNNIYLKLALGE